MTSPLAAKCPVCRKALLRYGNAKDGGFWFEHPTPEPYGPRVLVFEDDLSGMEPKRLLALMQRFHIESKEPRAPPGLGSNGEVERDPAINLEVVPNYKYEGD